MFSLIVNDDLADDEEGLDLSAENLVEPSSEAGWLSTSQLPQYGQDRRRLGHRRADLHLDLRARSADAELG